MNFSRISGAVLASFLLGVGAINAQELSALPGAHYFEYNIQAVLRNNVSLHSGQSSYTFTFPLPDGEEIEFAAKENGVLSDAIRAQYPDVWSMNLQAKDRPDIYGRLSIGGGKILASIQTPEGVATINPMRQNPGKFVSFWGNRHPESGQGELPILDCRQNGNGLHNHRDSGPMRNNSSSGSNFSIGGTLHTYRMAIAVTGEFYEENGDNDTDVMAEITFAMNGLNRVYEKDLSVTFTLVDPPVMYTDSSTDPFDPDDPRTVQAADVIAMNFDVNDYDVGHVLHVDSGTWPTGGQARIGVVCSNSIVPDGTGEVKGGGWTGSFFSGESWIQLFCHEVGHMFDATHTFNGEGGSCTLDNIASSSSYEIGSGTTIMSYEGICQDDNNIPAGGATYFHAHSLSQMSVFIDGTSCDVESSSGNDAPTVDANPNNASYTIPANTPFELEGEASDTDATQNNDLTYTWEQIDEDGFGTSTHGFIGATAAADPDAPLFRSIAPGSSPIRVIPRLPNILDGNNTGLDFEALPSVSRTLNFALTVRDNQNNAGGVGCDVISIEVEDTGEAFAVTSQNTATSYTADGSNTFTITWDVAGTTGGNISAATVDIYFSTDGGENFPYLLAENTTNDGTETVLVPELATTLGRIKIKGSDNIFFDINDSNITIISSDCAPEAGRIAPEDDCFLAKGDPSLDLSLSSVYGGVITDFSGTLENSDLDMNLVGYDGGDCTVFTNIVNYDFFTFRPTVTGSYSFTRTSSDAKVIYIYDREFFEDDPCVNVLDISWINNAPVFSTITVNLTAGDQYVLLINAFDGGNGAYTVEYSGPGDLMEGSADPGSDYDYTYLIVNTRSDEVVDIVDDPDLTGYARGCYKVYGVSYDKNNHSTNVLSSDYKTEDFGDFQSDVLNSTVCADLSNNNKLVEILCDAEAGELSLSPSTTVSSYLGSIDLDLSITPDFSNTTMPDADFAYTYIMANADDQNIIRISDQADLSSEVDFPVGEYLVYGLSYDESEGLTVVDLNNDYVGQDIDFLQDQIDDKQLCGDLSSNQVTVEILECEPDGGVVSSADAIELPVNDPGLAFTLSPIFDNVVSSVSGDLDSDDPETSTVFFPSASCISLGNAMYETVFFRVDMAGDYTFDQTPSGLLKTMVLYEDPFDPTDACGNALASSLVLNAPNFNVTNPLTVALEVDVDYVLVINSHRGTDGGSGLGAYTVAFSGPGQVIKAPGSDYNYTYVVVNDLNNEVVQISDSPDLTSTAIGDYTIYGISYENQLTDLTSLQNDFVGNDFSTLTTAMTDKVLCGAFSDNTKAVAITAPLPVDLLSFEATSRKADVLLEWTTANESNNKGFYVERSADGASWVDIGFVNGAGNSSALKAYELVDDRPLVGVSYYRLRQVDFDNAYAYSSIEIIERGDKDDVGFQVFPNPSNGYYHLTGHAALFEEANTRLIIHNQLGQEVRRFTSLSTNNTIDISDLANGIYFFSLETSKGKWTKKILKQ